MIEIYQWYSAQYELHNNRFYIELCLGIDSYSPITFKIKVRVGDNACELKFISDEDTQANYV